MSAYLLSLASPEFWSAWGFRALILGLAGDLVVLFMPTKYRRLERVLAAMFTLCAFAGIYVGHVGDEEIIAQVARRAQSAEAELATLSRSRHLTESEKVALISALASFAGQRISIIWLAVSPDAEAYAKDFADVFRAARWTIRGGVPSPRNVSVFPIGLEPTVSQEDVAANLVPESFSALMKALRGLRLLGYKGAFVDSKVPRQTIELRVGIKSGSL